MESPYFEKNPNGDSAEGFHNSELLTIQDAERLEERLMVRVERFFESFTKHPSVIEALALLESEADNSHARPYHNIEHTRDVIQKTILFFLAEHEELPDEDIENMLEKHIVAAAWHDTGIPEKTKVHEKDVSEEDLAVRLFEESESYGDFSEKDRADIVEMIRCTKIFDGQGNVAYPEISNEKAYMLDADLSNFGEVTFFAKSKSLAEETNCDLRDIEKRKAFFSNVSDLINEHMWRTKGAKKLKTGQREMNRHHLERLLPFINDTERFLKEFNKLVQL